MGSTFPTGTVTFLFTDIEGSTRLRQAEPEAYAASLAQHHALLRAAIEAEGGTVFKVIGDAVCAAFATAPAGLRAAVSAQRALHIAEWGRAPLRVRMALHTGAAELRDGDYWGFTLARAARLLPAGHGGQVLASQATADLVADELPPDTELRDLGERRLKDLVRPERLFQVCAAGLPDRFPPLKTLDAFPHNLPIQLTSFVGREAEIVEAKRLLGVTRLLTLLGPGGAGKSRLSLQVAAELVENFPDGVWWVELAPVTEAGLVAPTVAAALGLRAGARHVLDVLKDYLRSRTLLLVLDNCEHLLEACAHLADELLRASPQLRLLTSSREGLGLAGETTYRIPSLATPDVSQLPRLDRLTQYEAVRLFIERAQAVLPGFAVTNANAPAVAQICHQLDGIPLAIELAAARVRSFSPEQIAGRLDDRFRLLTGGSRTAMPRHQTLRAAVDWSHALLSEDERVLFRRLAVFAGGWTLEAAEAIHEPDSATAAFELLDSLVNKSLVTVERAGAVVRYRQLETMRQYAREKLAVASEIDTIRTRHLAYYLGLAEAAEPHLRRHEQLEWLARLDAEHDNLRVAMAWALDTAPVSVPQAALRLCVSLARYWESRSRIVEHLAWLERALAQPDPSPSALQARALYYYAGDLRQTQQRDPAAVGAIYQQALDIARLVGDRATEAYVLMQQGSEVVPEGDAGHDPFRRALALFEGLGNRWGQANTLNHMSQVANDRGDLNLAEELMQRALSLWQQEGDRSPICHALNQLGSLALWRGELDRALALLGEARLAGEACGDVDNLAWNHHWTAQVAYRRADFALMERLYQQYQLAKEKVGDRLFALAAQQWRGLAAGLQGDYERALSLQVPVLEVYRPMGSPFLTGWAQVHLATTHLERSDLPVALDLAQNGVQNLTAANNTDDLCTGLWCLGLARFHSGDHAGARQALTDAATTGRAITDPWQVGRALLGLGRVDFAQNHGAQAAHEVKEALAIFRRMGAQRDVAATLEALAQLAVVEAQPQRAAHLLGTAEALREEIGAPLPAVERTEHERTVAAVRAALGAAAFDAAWAEGRTTAWTTVVDDLLADTAT